MQFSQLSGPSLRILNILCSFLYWGVIASTSNDATAFFSITAATQIFVSFIPLGSNNHLANMACETQHRLFQASILFTGFCLPLGIFLIPSWSMAIPLLPALFLERIGLARAICSDQLNSHFLRIGLGRLGSLGIVYSVEVLPGLSPIATLLFLEILARGPLVTKLDIRGCFSCIQKLKQYPPNLEWQNTLFSALASFATWWPIAKASSETSASDLFLARVGITILGLSSIFHLSKEAMDYHKTHPLARIGWVRNPAQWLLIFLAIGGCVLMFFFASSLIGFELGQKLKLLRPYQFFTLIGFCSLWMLSWNGTIVIVRHSLKSESNLSIWCGCFALVIGFLPVPVYWQVFLIAVIWHLGVILFYSPKTPHRCDQRERPSSKINSFIKS